MLKRLIISLIVSYLVASSAYAGWSARLTVSEIVATGDPSGSGFIVIFKEIVGVEPSEGTCSGTHHYFDASTEKGKMIFTILLTAKVTKNQVNANLRQAGSSTRCIVDDVRY